MFKNTYQSGLLSIFYSCGSNPLGIWDMEVQNGHIKRVSDNQVNSVVLEIVGTNVSTTYITCPKKNQVLGIRLPFLVMIVKNLKRYFSFEITILDDAGMRRRFRISNFQSATKIKPFCTTMPIGLSLGWNQIQFNLADFTTKAYGTQFVETQRVQVHANARLRRIYFSDRLYSEEELPQDYKLYLPLERKYKKKEIKKEANVTPPVAKLIPPPLQVQQEQYKKEALAPSEDAISSNFEKTTHEYSSKIESLPLEVLAERGILAKEQANVTTSVEEQSEEGDVLKEALEESEEDTEEEEYAPDVTVEEESIK